MRLALFLFLADFVQCFVKSSFRSAICRYIEIFRSSLSEARAAVASIPRGGGGRGGGGGGSEGRYGGGGDRYGGGRPSPYDRNVDRFGGGPGQMRHHGGGHMRRRGELAGPDTIYQFLSRFPYSFVDLKSITDSVECKSYRRTLYARRRLGKRWATTLHGTSL